METFELYPETFQVYRYYNAFTDRYQYIKEYGNGKQVIINKRRYKKIIKTACANKRG